MSLTTVNFNDDLSQIRNYIASRVVTQSKIGKPVSAIEVGFQLCQAGLLLFHFDVRDTHKRDGNWTLALGGPTLELPHWQEAYEAAEEEGASFILLNGKSVQLPAGSGDSSVVGIFGEALIAMALDAHASGAFKRLDLKPDCQIDSEEFDGMWAWPAKFEDVGRTNILRELTAVRLPR